MMQFLILSSTKKFFRSSKYSGRISSFAKLLFSNLPSVTDSAYSSAVASLLSHVEDYYTTTGLELELSYSTGGWRIVTNTPMLNALCGGAAY